MSEHNNGNKRRTWRKRLAACGMHETHAHSSTTGTHSTTHSPLHSPDDIGSLLQCKHDIVWRVCSISNLLKQLAKRDFFSQRLTREDLVVSVSKKT